MFPQPGQPIDSFKEQTRSIPKPEPRVVPRTPRLDPKSRLFSRIQEITEHEERPEKEDTEAQTTQEEGSPVADPQPSSGETVQRQTEIPSGTKFEVTGEYDSTEEVEPHPGPEPEAEEYPELVEDEPDDVEPATLDQAEVTPPAPPRLEAEAVPQTTPPVKLARLVDRDRSEPGIRALPKAKVEPVAAPLPKAKSPPVALPLPKAKPSSTQPPRVQRSPDSPKPPSAKPVVEAVRPAADHAPPPHLVSEPDRGDDIDQIRPSATGEALPTTPSPEPKGESPQVLREVSSTTPLPQPSFETPPEVEAPSTAQTEEITPAPPPTEVEDVSVPEPVDEAFAPPSPESEIDTAEIQRPVDDVEDIPALEMPLRRKIESRGQVTGKLKSLEPEIIKSTPAVPLLIQRESSLIPAGKYRPVTQPGRRLDISTPPPLTSVSGVPHVAQEGVPVQSAPEGPDAIQRLAPPSPLDVGPADSQPEPLSMSLAYPRSPETGRMTTTPQLSAPQTLPPSQLPFPPGTPEELALQLMPETEELEPSFVPQTEDQPPEPGKVETVQRVDVPADEDELEVLEIDLDQLAEKVLPKVKRILEIESERLSRYRG
jgi:hypothetical protein